jgi:hypothetical protein
MRAETPSVLTGGMYAGLMGYGTVVLVQALTNVVAGLSPFHTAALLGSVLFYGLDDPAALVVAPGPVLAYNMIHLLVFLAFGILASWLVAQAEAYPILRYVVLFTLVFVAFHLYGGMLLLVHPLVGRSAAWRIGVPGVVAAVVMGAYLLWAHPPLWRSLRDLPMGAEAD